MKLDLTLRALFAVVENMPKPKTFLYDLLFTDRENIDVQEVQIEFKNGRRFRSVSSTACSLKSWTVF